jgi:replicative DNA helicase
MPVEHYPFDRSWQRKLLALLIVDGAGLAAGRLVRSEYFEHPRHAQVAAVALEMYDAYGVPLTFPAVEFELKPRVPGEELPQYHKLLQRLQHPIPDIEQDVILKQVRRFAQHQAFKSTMRSSLDLLERDQVEELETLWTKTLAVGKGENQREAFYFSTFSARNLKRAQRPEILATLIPQLDGCLSDGGFNKRELNVFLGLPNSGKSFALDHLAKAAIIQKKKVVFYSLEMSIEKVAARLDAAFAGVKIREIREHTGKIAKTMEQLQRKFGNSLLLKEYPAKLATVGTIRSDLLNLKLRGFSPDVLILDYINLLGRTGDSDNSYRQLGDVYIDLRSLIQEFNLWGITAGQSNRGGFNTDLITMKDIGESFEGAMHSDVIITLNQNQENKTNNIVRLYLAKNRNELANRVIPITIDFERALFYRRVAGG